MGEVEEAKRILKAMSTVWIVMGYDIESGECFGVYHTWQDAQYRAAQMRKERPNWDFETMKLAVGRDCMTEDM